MLVGSRAPAFVKVLACVVLALTGSAIENFLIHAQEVPTATSRQSPAFPGKTLHQGIRNLLEHYQVAVSKEPNAVANHVGVVEAGAMLWCFGFVPRDEVFEQMQASANRAVELDSQSAGARTALGIVELSDWHWKKAEHHFSAAVELDPRRAASRHWYAMYLAARGQHRQALEQSQAAVALEDSPGMKTGLAAVQYFGRDWQGMIDLLVPVTEKHLSFAPAFDWLGMAYVQQNKFDQSITTYKQAVELSEGLAEIHAGLGHAYGLAGKREQALAVLDTLNQQDARWYVPPVQLAYVHVGLGDYDKVFQLLDRAVREYSWELVFLPVEPWFDPVRADPRFQQLVNQLQLPQE